MARASSSTKSKKPRKRPASPTLSPEAQTTLDPAIEPQIRRLLSGFFKRMIVLFLLVSLLSPLVVMSLRLPMVYQQACLFFAAFGVMLPYWRGMNRIFQQIKQIGIEKYRQRRYADARHALEYFHRVGNMGFDLDGEAHYYLTLACIGLGDLERAAEMTVWLQKNRRRAPWPEKAATALQNAQRAHARASEKEAME